MSKPKPALNTATTIAAPMIIVNSVCWGLWVGVGETVGKGVIVGVAVGDGTGVGVGVGGISGASGFGAVRNGVKLTFPKLKSSSKSKINSLIACVSVVPHQLCVALTSLAAPSER